jgi:Glycosyltransferase family 28 C-terminal domain
MGRIEFRRRAGGFMNAPASGTRRVDLIFFDAGGGHRASATALAAAANAVRRSWYANPVNLRDLLGSIDFIHNSIGVRFEDFYNGLLKRGLTVATGAMLRFSQMLIALKHEREVALLARHWRESAPALVMSLIPNFNRAIFQGLRHADEAAGRAPTPMVTALTDFADYPPHFWIERQPQYFICGSDRAVSQARSMGHPADHIFQTSGMILHPRFYEPPIEDKVAERVKLGLRPDLPTALVLFGGFGSGVMLDIAERLDRSNLELQLIFICGKNEKLARALRERTSRLPRFVEGFTTRVNQYMQTADFFIGKPGPGSVSEALAMHLPVIVERNAWTLPQERYNADWILENEVGEVLNSFRQIVPAVARLIDPPTLMRYRANAAAMKNQAVFEIPDIFQRIFEHSHSSANEETRSDAVTAD